MENPKGAVATRRLFFGLWPDDEIRSQLARVATALHPDVPGEPVSAGNLHCTLVFLGPVRPDQQLCIEAAASALKRRSFRLRLDRFGYFHRPQVAWVGSTETVAELESLVLDLGRACGACGFPPESRPYSAHVTIARAVRRDPGRPMILPLDWPIDRFALIESMAEPGGGVRYVPVRFWPLKT